MGVYFVWLDHCGVCVVQPFKHTALLLFTRLCPDHFTLIFPTLHAITCPHT